MIMPEDITYTTRTGEVLTPEMRAARWQAPPVMRGMQEVYFPGVGRVPIPRAIWDRIKYDMSVAYQNQRAPSMQTQMGAIFRPPREGQYVAYAGLQPELKRLETIYSGQGRVNPYAQQLDELMRQYRMQRQQPMQIDPSGRPVGRARPPVTERKLLDLETKTNRQEKRQREQLMRDYARFKQIGRQRTESNLPVRVVEPTTK